MLTPEERKELEEKQLKWQKEHSVQKEKERKLYEANKEKVDERRKKESASNALMAIGWIFLAIGVIGLLFFDGIACVVAPIVGAVLFALFLVLRLKPIKAVKALTAELTEYDSKNAEITGELNTIQGHIFSIEDRLKRDACERRWAEYNEGHVCVYVGTSTSKGTISDGKPQETADHYADVADVVVYIDGIEYGGTQKPCGAFEVTPGNHVVKIVAHYNFGGVDKYVESKATQVKISDKSAFLFYHWNFYKHGSGIAEDLYLKTFDNPYDFLVHTHQEHC